ncbi:LAMI_0C01002g1_1 [Lachancea mirantina]|uniref:LAMI_0C01002g1_1 n=1 Tax=Lachancea mirantina TaxID=1230905 RepID=A0A1G4IZT9_9SACH|nr:LAMI_0C01002g1_1 [Lachancea mirantina]
MDTRALLNCFLGTLSHDSKIRSSAENELKSASKTPGFLGACLDIISSDGISEHIKLSTSLYFKNKILYGWSGKQQGKNELLHYSVDNDEKPVVKEMLVRVLVHCSLHSPNCVRLLLPALTVIVSEEYPAKRWDSLLGESFNLLTSNDVNSAHVGLMCLAEIFRTYRWKENDDRQELEHLILNYFPSILAFASSTLQQGEQSRNDSKIGDMIKLVLKIFKFVTYHDLPFSLQRTENFVPWANLHVLIIEQPLSVSFLESTLPSDRKLNSWVKAKKWAYANMYRMFQRYASESLSRKFSYDEFRWLYLNDFYPQLLQLFFVQIEQWGSGSLWLSNEALYYILGFVEQTVVQKKTWPLMKPHYMTVLQHVIFPLLCLNEEALAAFENDPHEYIHRNLEACDEDYLPDLAALSLLTTSVTKRGKTTLQPTMQFVTEKLHSHVDSIASMELATAVEMESLLRIFSNILHRLTQKNSPFLGELEELLRTLVFPFFRSPFAFLRARVCELSSKLGEFEIKNEDTSSMLFRGILSCYSEENDSLPVVLLAALALQAFLHVPEFRESISTNVVPAMQKLLYISNEIESDAISGVMQDFVENFSEQLQPFGVELMNNLVQQFLKLAIDLQESSAFDINTVETGIEVPDSSDKQMAAMGILSTAISILLSFENSPEIVKSLEQSFYPAAEFILKNEMEDFYREVCELIENSTFLLRVITPISWKVLELIGDCNRKPDSMVAFYLEDFMLALNNYLVYGKQELRKNDFYANIVFEIYVSAVSSADNGFDEMAAIFDLSQKVLLTLGEDINPAFVERFLNDALDAISSESKELKNQIVFGVNAFNVVVACLTCFPEVTLQALQSKNLIELFFSIWCDSYIPKFKRVYDIKLSVMAILSIIGRVSAEDLNAASLWGLFAKFGPLSAHLMSALPHALALLEEKRKEYISDGAENAADTSFFEWTAPDDEEEPDGDDEEAFNDFLKDEAEILKMVNEQAEAFGEFEDFDDLEEDPLSGSVLDEINIYDAFKTVINALQSDQTKHRALVSGLSPENQEVFFQLMNI